MEEFFRSVGKQIYKCGKHVGFLVPWKEVGPRCRKWAGNRDCDPVRVAEMRRFREGGGYMPLYLHLAEIPEGLVCYDGNHRREVLDQMGGEEWVIADVIFRATMGEVLDSFDNLNKSVQVPALFIERGDPSVKDAIIALADKYVTHYADFVSPSPHCKCPNFNRDLFVADLTNIHQDFAGSISVAELEELLGDVNTARANGRLCKPHNQYAESAIRKCRRHGFWLFLDRHVSPDVVRSVWSAKKAVAATAPRQIPAHLGVRSGTP